MEPETAGWVIPPVTSENEADGSGAVIAVFKFENSVNCCGDGAGSGTSATCTDGNGAVQTGKATCRVTFDTEKNVLLTIWGNTERQDAPYDISEIKITSQSGVGCNREFVTKKCQNGDYWQTCDDAALGSDYEQCCSPLLALKGQTNIGLWYSENFNAIPPIDYATVSTTAEMVAHYIHPNLTLSCPKADVIGVGGDGALGTCDIEPIYWHSCPDHQTPPGGAARGSHPIAAWRRLSPLRVACPEPSNSGDSSASAEPMPAYFLADDTVVQIKRIFYVENPTVLPSFADFPQPGQVGELYEDGATGAGYFYVNSQYEQIDGYDNTKINWYALVRVTYDLIWFEQFDAELFPWGPVRSQAQEYYAKLSCDKNGKPIGVVPPPPATSSSEASDVVFNCNGEEPTGYALDTTFPTIVLYKPGMSPGDPTSDEKPPVTPAPEWCGDGGKTTGEPCATLGVECFGCEKVTAGEDCGAQEIIARTCISGTDENLGCAMGDQERCRLFTLPAGEYLINFTADTKDGLFHVNMEHNFRVEWRDAGDTALDCAQQGGSSSSSSPVSSSSSAISSSSDNCVNPVLYLEMNMEGADGATNFVDTSPNNSTLIPANATMTTAYKYSGNTSAQFNGGYISVSNADLSKFNQIFNNPYAPFTIEAWVYPTVLPENTSDAVLEIATDWYVLPSRWLFSLRRELVPVGSNAVQLDFVWTYGNSQGYVTSTAYANLNAWNYVAVTRDSNGKFAINLNGEITEAHPYFPAMPAHNTGSFRVGGRVGYIDNFKFLGCGTDSDNSSSSSVGIGSSSSSSAQAIPLFNKSSWASTVPEPYRTYLNAAADRWMLYAAFDPAVSAAIKALDSSWNGIALVQYTEFFNTLNGANYTNTLALCGVAQYVDLVTSGASVKFNSVSYALWINTAYSTNTNGVGPLTAAQWIDVLTHELGHALGIGIFWGSDYAVGGAVVPVNNFLNGGSYTQAQSAYNAVTGLTRSKVPLEDAGGGGTVSAHWENNNRTSSYTGGDGVSYSGLFDELMIGAINISDTSFTLKLTQLSLKILVDFGYQQIGAGEGSPQLSIGAALTTEAGGQLKLNCTDVTQPEPTCVGTIYLSSPPFDGI